MANASNIGATDTLSRQLYEEQLFSEQVAGSLVGRMMGEVIFDADNPSLMETSIDSVIQMKTNLEKGKGGQLLFQLLKNSFNQGVTGNTTLEGNEEDLTVFTHNLTLEQYRHAVKYFRLSDQRATSNLPEAARTVIKNWGVEKLDKLAIDGWTASPTDIFYTEGNEFKRTATAATAANALTADDKITIELIQQLNAFADTGGDTAQTNPQRIIRPATIPGESGKMRVLITHPDSVLDLKRDPEYQEFVKDARERGRTNPFFTGAVAIIDNVVIFPHRFVPVLTNTTNINYSKSVFCGAQSLLQAFGVRPELDEETFDYKNKIGTAWHMIAKAEKAVFNSIDYGSYGVYIANSGVSSTTVDGA